METKAEILLVDDHALILEGMQRMLELVPGVKVADAVTSGTRAAELIGTDLHNLETFGKWIGNVRLTDKLAREIMSLR